MRNRAVFTQAGFGLGYRFLHCGKGFEAHTSSCVWVLGASQKRSHQRVNAEMLSNGAGEEGENDKD